MTRDAATVCRFLKGRDYEIKNTIGNDDCLSTLVLLQWSSGRGSSFCRIRLLFPETLFGNKVNFRFWILPDSCWVVFACLKNTNFCINGTVLKCTFLTYMFGAEIPPKLGIFADYRYSMLFSTKYLSIHRSCVEIIYLSSSLKSGVRLFIALVLLKWIRDLVPFWPLDPGWVKLGSGIF